MNLGTILHFLVTHAETIFSVTLALILLLSGVLIFRNFFSRDVGGGEATAADLNRIEDSLRKILSQTHGQAGAGPAASGEAATNVSAGAAPAAAVAPPAAVAAAGPGDVKLQQEVEARTKQIEELKKQIEAAKTQDNTPELLAKIKSLEERLTEYEIIEDDIADLSIYKEENARLKKELEGLKSGAPATEAAPTPEAAVEPTPAAEIVAPSTPATKADLVEEFESAVQNLEKQKAAAPAEAVEPEPVAPAAEAPDAPVAPAAPAVAAPAAAPAEDAKTDIFAEMQGEGQSQDLLAELGDIDADRMLEEIKDLGEGMGDAGVLDEALDIDKIASEADKKGS